MSNRNAIKYRPFAAVEGYFEKLEEVTNNHHLVEKPIPSEDDEERINRVLIEAFHSNREVIITLFNGGSILEKIAAIEKFNNNDKTLLLSDNTRIRINDIINAK